MRSLFIAAALLVACTSCGRLPAPTTPPSPSVWPPADGDACEAECSNLDALKCPGGGAHCVGDCRHLDFVLAEHAQNPVDHACMAAVRTCQEAEQCR